MFIVHENIQNGISGGSELILIPKFLQFLQKGKGKPLALTAAKGKMLDALLSARHLRTYT